MAIDPGGTTGVAFGVFRPRKMAKSTMVYARGANRLWTQEVKGTPREQASELFDIWQSFMVSGPPKTHLVIEDFQLRTQNADLSPVRITAGLEALLNRDIERQMPSSAKSFLTDARMRDWGLWVVGSDHERDAMRHLALKVSRLL